MFDEQDLKMIDDKSDSDEQIDDEIMERKPDVKIILAPINLNSRFSFRNFSNVVSVNFGKYTSN